MKALTESLLKLALLLLSFVLHNTHVKSNNLSAIHTDHMLRMYRSMTRKRISYFLKASKSKQQRRSHVSKGTRKDEDGSQIRLSSTAVREDAERRLDTIISSHQPTGSYIPEESELSSHAKQTKRFETSAKEAIHAASILDNAPPSVVGEETQATTTKTPRSACQCERPGCLRCFPGDEHGIHCGSSSCEQCVDRGPGFDGWHICQTGSDDNIFTDGDAILARTFDGEQNVLALILSRKVYTAMRNSVIEGRRYRKTKREIDADLDKINEDAQPAWNEYTAAVNDLKVAKWNSRFRSPSRMLVERRSLKEAKGRVRRAQQAYRGFKTCERRLKGKLQNAEQRWFATLTDIDFYQAMFLEHAGALSQDKDKGWPLKAYEYHHRIRSRHYGDGDFYEGEDTNTDSSISKATTRMVDSEAPEQAQRTYNEELADIKDEWVQHLAGFEAKLQSARQQHDYARGTHGPLLEIYIQDNPDRDSEELKDEYGPQFVQLNRKYVKMIQDAEEALEGRRAAAKAAGIDPYAENAYDLGGDEKYLDTLVAKDAEKLIANVDRRKISRWLDSFRRYEPWPVLKLDSDGGFGSETSSIASASSTGSSDSAGSQTFDGAGPRPPHHSLKRDKLMTTDVNLDSISVFNDDDYIRRHVDSWATEKRGGYL